MLAPKTLASRCVLLLSGWLARGAEHPPLFPISFLQRSWFRRPTISGSDDTCCRKNIAILPDDANFSLHVADNSKVPCATFLRQGCSINLGFGDKSHNHGWEGVAPQEHMYVGTIRACSITLKTSQSALLDFSGLLERRAAAGIDGADLAESDILPGVASAWTSSPIFC